jgi:hypothetical protein
MRINMGANLCKCFNSALTKSPMSDSL